ncbi:hypothetical protein GCM10010885_03100 [Alicyclobacillus cellulosilyticus]|uniref:DUF86 domain-containing protein n=1 Tax=Alicyclobacillus cellulosilyticus TaxID=1003997 RepID=A0A917NFR4_9BACL|nr:DUF86 domain-containing protein [Alicyclobacillus cellulosilyticus]GGI96853.1 hypothetical protein GCM10010885_03100 [Alicyclobacillus cellulosilyticus]
MYSGSHSKARVGVLTIDNVIHNKLQTIRRCCQRIWEEYGGTPTNLENITKQDAIILNLQRACEAAIDLAMHVVAVRKLGFPQTSREAFEMLEQAGIIDETTCRRMKAMVGFRNIAIHDYQSIDIDVVQTIIEKHLTDFQTYCDQVLRAEEGAPS